MTRHRFDDIPSSTARAVLPGLLLTAAGVWAFAGVLDQLLERDDLYLVDQPVLNWLVSVRTPWLTTVLTWITNAFGPTIVPIVVGVACAVWGKVTAAWRDPLLLASAMAASTVVAAVLKAVVARPRPASTLQVVPGLEESYSFPSGHATGAATLVLVTAYLLWRHRHGVRSLAIWSVVSLGTIVLVGGSRLYLGYHFVTDVIAGTVLGVVTLGLVIAASRWLDLRQRRLAGASGPTS